MNRISLRRALLGGAAALTTALLTAGCGGNDHPSGMDHGAGAPGGSASASVTGQVNDSDVMFAQMMIPHHQQAVEMAELAATRAGDAELKSIAAEIKAAQDPEIATMTGWLKAWGRPTAAPGGHGSHGMPGMMSEADMNALKSLSGTEFDRKFAQLMIAHHEGAIQMAEVEQASGVNPEAKKLATEIATSQAAEVKELKGILDRL